MTPRFRVACMSLTRGPTALQLFSWKIDRNSLVGVTRRRAHQRRQLPSSTCTLHGISSQASSSSGKFKPSTWRDLDIDWGRRHLQVIFVDQDHGVLARSAEGCCQRVALWAGAGHMVFPESAGLLVDVNAARNPDAAMALLNRTFPICDHHRYAQREAYLFTDQDAASVDLVISVGGAGVERLVSKKAPSAANVVDLMEFAQFAKRDELDGTGGATILQRNLATEVVAPWLAEAFAMTSSENWGLVPGGEGGKDGAFSQEESQSSETYSERAPSSSKSALAAADAETQRKLKIARARVVIGVTGLVTFLLAIAPLEEVERRTKR